MRQHTKLRLCSLGMGLAFVATSLPAQGAIKVTEVTWLKNSAWKIEGAANGTFYFENGKTAGKTGFSSAIDQEGKDWIYNNGKDTSDGNDHEFRGFPNFGDDDFNHPQRSSSSTSSWKDGKMEGESLIMESLNPNYKVEYYFFASHIAIKVIEAKKPYSFLYEGPIGGKSEPTIDWSVGASDPIPGKQRAILNSVSNFPDPAYPNNSLGLFFYLGDPVAKQVFFIAKTPDTAEPDEGRGQGNAQNDPLGKNNMAIFSFGRGGGGRKLTGTNHVCTFGFLDKAQGHEKIKAAIDATQASPFAAASGGGGTGTGGAGGSASDGGLPATGGAGGGISTGTGGGSDAGSSTATGGSRSGGAGGSTTGTTGPSDGSSTGGSTGGTSTQTGGTATGGVMAGGTTASAGGSTSTTAGSSGGSSGSTGGKSGTSSSSSGGCSMQSKSSSWGMAGLSLLMLAWFGIRRRRHRS